MSKIRGFELVEDWARKNTLEKIILPYRSTKYSAGYDFVLCGENIKLFPGETHIYYTDIKAYMLPDEFLQIFIRSSIAIKKNVVLMNNVGIIDHDYYSNIKNDGSIIIPLMNVSDRSIANIMKGEKIAQGVFTKYFTVDHEKEITNDRTGGVGSTE